ncbi:MAG: enoyl-CoA hydratase/isomerase family protein [Pseudomonadales bacterium]|nr:enoyl-CoA hydratase/isomerase family protein [Pseudomonadales bacterium]
MADVTFEQRGAVAWITINRPEARNVLGPRAFVELADAWDEVRRNAAVRVAVLSGAGEKDFCCGGDLGGLIPLWTGARTPADAIEQRLLDDPGIPDRVLLKGEPLYKPIVCAVNGRALGGGCEILQATDVRIAATHAEFGLPEPKLGIVPGGGSMVRLARQIPYAHAMRLLLMGEPIDAQTALGWGLVSEVVPGSQLLARAEAVAARIAANAPLALAAIKRTALESHAEAWGDAFAREARESATVMMSKDAREGPRAFKEKRQPAFRGE